MTPSAVSTKDQIIGAALAVLRRAGTEGLTLRMVAREAGISLGNLQYHYPGKSALLGGLAQHYFETCRALLEQSPPMRATGPGRAQLEALIRYFLDHVDHLSDMCRVFREIWALATRERQIEALLDAYYADIHAQLSHMIAPICPSPEAADRVCDLLIPYFEGYSITHPSLSQTKDQTAKLLTDLCWQLGQL